MECWDRARVCGIYVRACVNPARRSAKSVRECPKFTSACTRIQFGWAKIGVWALEIYVRVFGNPSSLGWCLRSQFPASRKFRSGALESCAIARDICAGVRESCAGEREIGARVCGNRARLCGNSVSHRENLVRGCARSMSGRARTHRCWACIAVSNFHIVRNSGRSRWVLARDLFADVRESCAEERKIGARVFVIHLRFRPTPDRRRAKYARGRARSMCGRARILRYWVGFGVSNCHIPWNSGRAFWNLARLGAIYVRPRGNPERGGPKLARARVRNSRATARASILEARKIGALNVRACENHVSFGRNRLFRFPDSRNARSVELESCAIARDLCAGAR